jgi:hypothetical protein
MPSVVGQTRGQNPVQVPGLLRSTPPACAVRGAILATYRTGTLSVPGFRLVPSTEGTLIHTPMGHLFSFHQVGYAHKCPNPTPKNQGKACLILGFAPHTRTRQVVAPKIGCLIPHGLGCRRTPRHFAPELALAGHNTSLHHLNQCCNSRAIIHTFTTSTSAAGCKACHLGLKYAACMSADAWGTAKRLIQRGTHEHHVQLRLRNGCRTISRSHILRPNALA